MAKRWNGKKMSHCKPNKVKQRPRKEERYTATRKKIK
jgi:hypothetical protein